MRFKKQITKNKSRRFDFVESRDPDRAKRASGQITNYKSKIPRIIDANINRCVEGLRVVEEIVRFIIENKKLTEKIKKLRSKIRNTTEKAHLLARKANKDVGSKIYTRSESKRENLKDICIANIKRAEEALRVLEEFSKLDDPKLGSQYKKHRFELYEIEAYLAKNSDFC